MRFLLALSALAFSVNASATDTTPLQPAEVSALLNQIQIVGGEAKAKYSEMLADMSKVCKTTFTSYYTREDLSKDTFTVNSFNIIASCQTRDGFAVPSMIYTLVLPATNNEANGQATLTIEGQGE